MSCQEQEPDRWPPARELALTTCAFAAIYALLALPAVLGLAASGGPGAGERAVAPSLLLAAALVVLSAVDWLTERLPDALTLPLVAAGVILQWPGGPAAMLGHAAAAALGFGLLAGGAWIYETWRGRAGLGLGDAKLFAAAGAWLSAAALAAVVLVASFAALLAVAVTSWRRGGVALSDRIAFGPYLGLAIWLVWLYASPGR